MVPTSLILKTTTWVWKGDTILEIRTIISERENLKISSKTLFLKSRPEEQNVSKIETNAPNPTF